jgi:hypothetical protein
LHFTTASELHRTNRTHVMEVGLATLARLAAGLVGILYIVTSCDLAQLLT